MFAFLLKKLLGALAQPAPLIGLLLLAGVAALWRAERRGAAGGSERGRRRGLLLVTAACGLYWLAASPLTARALLEPLEAEVPCLPDAARPGGPGPVAAIVVLGAGYHPAPGRPLTAALSSHAVARTAEAVRLARLHPEAALHCTGWGGSFPGSNGEAACALAVALGVEASRTHAHPQPRDTAEEAAAIAAAVPRGRVLVVTDARHMPRALGLFRRAGVDAVGAPMGHIVAGAWSWWPLPSRAALGHVGGAWHEWLGRAWAWAAR